MASAVDCDVSGTHADQAVGSVVEKEHPRRRRMANELHRPYDFDPPKLVAFLFLKRVV